MPGLITALSLLLAVQGAEGAPAPVPAPAEAQAQRLSQEEIDRILNEAENRAFEQERQRVHGEVGVSISTGGGRSVFGTALIPLGDNAGAAVSFESTRFPTFERETRRERRAPR